MAQVMSNQCEEDYRAIAASHVADDSESDESTREDRSAATGVFHFDAQVKAEPAATAPDIAGNRQMTCPTCLYKNDPGVELCEICDQRIAEVESKRVIEPDSNASLAALMTNQAQELERLLISSRADDDEQKLPAKSPQNTAIDLDSQREIPNMLLLADEVESISKSTLSAGNDEGHLSLAAMLQIEESLNFTNQQERLAMKSTNQGRAWIFAEKVFELHCRLESRGKLNPCISTISVDDMVFLAERFLDRQTAFQDSGHPCKVVLMYHYTNEHFIGSIRQGGLMSSAERTGCYIDVTSRGSLFGDGIYTATNPFAFNNYGNLGLLVAVLLGNTQRVSQWQHDVDTSKINAVIGNKLLYAAECLEREEQINESFKFFDEYVLLQSSQCLPLIRFRSSLISTSSDESVGNAAVWSYHEELQREVDDFFNDGSRTKLNRILPSMNPKSTGGNASHTAHSSSMTTPRMPTPSNSAVGSTQLTPNATCVQINQVGRGSNFQIHQAASCGGLPSDATLMPTAIAEAKLVKEFLLAQQQSFHMWEQLRSRNHNGVSPAPPSVVEILKYEAPNIRCKLFRAVKFRQRNPSTATCALCFQQINVQESPNPVSLNVCHHIFHSDCIKHSLNTSPRCPICREFVGTPLGKSPSGEMAITTTPLTCAGYEDCNQSIAITYSMSGGTQMSYHKNPGVLYIPAQRVAYLPDSDDGRNLLKRLKKAFMQGLTFTIGTSLSTGRPNSIVWSSISHKTSRSGGIKSFGFPDPTYFYICNQELDNLGVPPSADC